MSEDLSIPNAGYRGNRAGRYGTGNPRNRPGMDTDTRRLLMFAGGLGVVLVTLIGASALIGRHGSTEVPVVTADPRPIRVKPENPGGMKIDGAENDVFSAGADTAGSKLAPPSETPDRKAMRAAADSPPSPALAAPAPSPAVVAPAPPVVLAAPAPAPLVPPPVIRPAAVAPPRPAPLPKPPVAAQTHPPASGHQPMVQLAALTSEEAARTEWQILSKRMPDLLNGRQPNLARVERDGHPIWRLRTTGFTDDAQARLFCDRVRAKGAACSVGDL